MLRDRMYGFRAKVMGDAKLNSLAMLPTHIRNLITPPCPQIVRAWDVLLGVQDSLFSSAPRLELAVDGIDDVSILARRGLRAAAYAVTKRSSFIPQCGDVQSILLLKIHTALYRDYINIEGVRELEGGWHFVDVVLNSPACRGV